VAQHIGDGMVRTIALKPTDGMVRGSPVENTGSPISVPVGEGVLGHVYNVLGEPLDTSPDQIHAADRWPIHRQPPPFEELEPKQVMLETGHQGHRPARALRAGRQDRDVRRRRGRARP
jgi:F-type H+-transporting ATPase subunit beta